MVAQVNCKSRDLGYFTKQSAHFIEAQFGAKQSMKEKYWRFLFIEFDFVRDKLFPQ